ncbi:MAG: LPXTG cell wall anchor domain-containing protein [Eubacteriales bacterium]|nr:LPXTG cell wall anchor domain-containing protein [Eubacteriales bacterium]
MKKQFQSLSLLALCFALIIGILPIYRETVFADIPLGEKIELTAKVGEEFSVSHTASDKDTGGNKIRHLFVTDKVYSKTQDGYPFDEAFQKGQAVLENHGLHTEGGIFQANPPQDPVTIYIKGTPTKAGTVDIYYFVMDNQGNKRYTPITLTISESEPDEPTPTPDPEPNTSPKEIFTITFDPADGRWEDGSTDPVVMDCKQGEVITILEAPRKAGAKFLYWEGSRYYPSEEYVVEGDHTFTARYDDLPEVDTYLLYESVNGTPETQPTQTTISTMPAETNPAPSQPLSSQNSLSPQNLPKTGEQAAYTPLSVISAVAGIGLLIALRKKLGK